MKVFLDTNILVDVVENREGTIIAKNILQLGRNSSLELFASYIPFMSSRDFLLQCFVKNENDK